MNTAFITERTLSYRFKI